jgi:hypothetical protein
VVALALTGLAGTALGLALSSLVRKSDQAIFLLPVALVVQMALSLPLLQLQNPNPLTQQVGKIISASWGMSAVASTVSLNQLMSAYLWSLAFGQQEVKRIFTGSQTPLIRPGIAPAVALPHISMMMVTGPSLMRLTCITAPKTPVSTRAPSARRDETTAPTSGSATGPGAAACQVGRRPFRVSA